MNLKQCLKSGKIDIIKKVFNLNAMSIYIYEKDVHFAAYGQHKEDVEDYNKLKEILRQNHMAFEEKDINLGIMIIAVER